LRKREREKHTHTHKREREKERKRERERDPSNTRRAILPEKRDSEGKKRDDGLLEMVCWCCPGRCGLLMV
jgi:hypothetical protein